MIKQEIKKKINIRIIMVIMSLCLIALFFIPLATLTFNGATIQDEKIEKVVTISSLFVEGQNFTPVNDLGMFSKISFTNQLTVVVLGLLLGIAIFAIAIMMKKWLKKWMYLMGTVSLIIIPIYTFFIINSNIKVVQEISKYKMGIGTLVSIAAGFIFLYLRNKVRFINDEGDNYLEESERLRLLYIVGSFVIIIAMFFPMFGIDYKTGLSSYKTYNFTFSNFLLFAKDINIKVFYSIYRENINLAIMSVFWALPITSIVTIILASLRKKRFVKVFTLIQGVLAIASTVIVVSTLKANAALFPGVKRLFTSYGAVVLFAAGILLLVVLIRKKDEQPITDVVERSRSNHRFAYKLLGMLGLILYVCPQAGISTKALNELALKEIEIIKNFKLLFNQHQIAGLTNNYATYIGYLIPIGIILMFVLLFLNKNKFVKVLALINGILLFVTPLINRSVLNNILKGIEVAEFRMSYVLAMLVGAVLILITFIDKEDKETLSKARRKVNNTAKAIILAGFGIIQLYPLLWLFLASFMSEKEMFSGKVLQLPEIWHIEHYSKVLFGTRADETIMESIQRITGDIDFAAVIKFITGNTADGNIVRYFANSFFVVGLTIVIVLLCAAMVSYALTRIEWKGSKLMYGFFILGMTIPVHVALAPLYVAFADIGIIGSLWSLIIPYAGFGLSFAIIVLSGFMQSIPKSIEESATIDGAGRFKIFSKIILPMLKPSLATVMIFTFMGSWNELMFASIFINKGVNRTITVGINHLSTAQYNTEYGLIFAGLVVASLPTLIFYLIASDKVQKSLVVGAVKE